MVTFTYSSETSAGTINWTPGPKVQGLLEKMPEEVINALEEDLFAPTLKGFALALAGAALVPSQTEEALKDLGESLSQFAILRMARLPL